MTEQQRQHRAAFIREQPALWLFLLYAVTFFGGAVAGDMLSLAGGGSVDRGLRYILPFVIALPIWRSLRKWAQQILASS